jgi:hypothetical protein
MDDESILAISRMIGQATGIRAEVGGTYYEYAPLFLHMNVEEQWIGDKLSQHDRSRLFGDHDRIRALIFEEARTGVESEELAQLWHAHGAWETTLGGA